MKTIRDVDWMGARRNCVFGFVWVSMTAALIALLIILSYWLIVQGGA